MRMSKKLQPQFRLAYSLGIWPSVPFHLLERRIDMARPWRQGDSDSAHTSHLINVTRVFQKVSILVLKAMALELLYSFYSKAYYA